MEGHVAGDDEEPPAEVAVGAEARGPLPGECRVERALTEADVTGMANASPGSAEEPAARRFRVLDF